MEKPKLLKYIESTDTHDLYVIQIPKEKPYNYMPKPTRIIVAHDYVRIIDRTFLNADTCREHLSSNLVGVYTDVSINIKDMIDIVLPYFNEHKYLQKEHIKDQINHEDDKYYKKYYQDKPRYKKGDPYPAYAYMASIIEFFEEGNLIVNFRRIGEKNWDKLQIETFNLVKDTLFLCKSKWDILRDKIKI